MTGELSLFGVLMPPLLVSAGLAVAVTAVARRVLAAIGAYRWIWHPALFDVAFFVLCLAGIDAVVFG